MKKTKIVATIGPATETEATLRELVDAGMNMARFNTKHGTVEWHQEAMHRARTVGSQMRVPLAILLDLQGPEIRVTIPGEQTIQLNAGDHLTFVADESNDPRTPFIPQIVIDALAVGDTVLIDDGLGEMRVVEHSKSSVTVEAVNSFPVGNRKTLNTPGIEIDLPSLIQRDYEHLDAASNELVDYVGLSFVRNASDIHTLRSELDKRGLTAGIMSKIENQAALDNLDEIIAVSDAVMVARGDLAVEAPYEQLTYWQKEIIRRCRERGIPVVTATQMLKSMVENPRPTRAEVSDVSHAIYDGTDAVMLSEETTIGKYPVEAVRVQAKIASYTEQNAAIEPIATKDDSVDSYITHAAISLLEIASLSTNKVHVDKLVCLTETGTTARLMARFRPPTPIHAITSNIKTYNKLALLYSVTPHVINLAENHLIENSEFLREQILAVGIAREGEHVVVIHGTYWKKPGLTNNLSVLHL